MRGWKCLGKFFSWECCVCSLLVLPFFCAPLRSSSSTQRSYRKDYFLGMLSSSSYSFTGPRPRCAGLPKERMWPFDNRIIQQFVLVWSYFPWFPVVFFLSLFVTNGKVCYARNAKFWSPLTAIQFPVQQHTPETWFQPGAVLFVYAIGCASTELPKHVFWGFLK